jgi:serine carboxypeptidase-like clade 1
MSRTWANNEIVREALGIHMVIHTTCCFLIGNVYQLHSMLQEAVPLWIRCNYDILYANDIHSSVKYHLEVTKRGYKCLVYSCDHDMVIPFIGTQAWIRSLNFSVVNEWRPWYVDAQVAG